MRIVHDVRYAARALRRSPAFAIATVLVLAIGIGANTAVFSVARGVLLRPLPYPEPDRLVQFVSHLQTGRAALASVPKYRAWRTGISREAFEGMTAYHAGAGVTLVAGDRKVHLDALYVTADYFDVFGAPVDQGRAFTRAEDVPQGPRVAVISRALAVREYGTGENPVGKVISLGGVPHEIVGVLGAGFRSIPDADIWLPLQAPEVSFNHTNYLTVVARLRHGVSVRRASLQAVRTTDAFRQKFPLAMAPWEEFGAEPFAEMVAGDTGPALRMLVGAVSFVLLIACANAANLLVARATRRRADIATRAALGASRLRLVRQLFAECLLLSFAGGTLGLAAGYLGVRALLAATPGALPRLPDVAPDASILLFTLAASLVTAILFGLLPILGASRVDLSTALKDSASDGATAARRHGGQAALVVIEMTLAIVLLVGAGLMLRTFVSLRTVDRGFDPADVLTLEMPLTDGRFDTADRVTGLVQDVERRLRDLPAVKTTAASFALPLQPTLALPFTLLDRPLLGATYHGVGTWLNVSPAYFDALRIRLYRGRMFDIHDDAGAQPVAIISLTMARRFWQNNDPLGRKVLIGQSADHEFDEPPRTIVGIVNDVRDGGAAPEPRLYVPIAQTTDRLTARNNRYFSLTWIVRGNADVASLRTAIEGELRAASGDLPLARVRPMSDIVRAATAELQFTTVLLTVFAACALVLAAIGLYGLMAYSVQQRTKEIGIRMALGAEPGALRNMVLVEGGRLTAGGIAVGLAAALTGSKVMASLVFGIATWDPAVFAAVAGLLGAVALAAVYVPALHATRVSPLTALRR